MAVWERERVLSLATDHAARQAAVGLARPDRWLSCGTSSTPDGTLLWGRCLGSARTPYQTAVVAGAPPAYACSCPSRKHPCKHAVGLLLRWSQHGIAEADPPAYARDLVTSRSRQQDRAQAPDRAPGELADPAAAARRVAQRAERVTGGLEELDQWLADQIRTGLAGLERAGYRHFDGIAARMVDAQAPGVASMLRALPGELASDGWPERLLDQLAALHLLVQAHRRLDELDPDLAATVRSRVGYPISKAEVLAGPGVVDHWIGLGMVDTVEYRLETRRVWLYGGRTGTWAMLLSFAVPGGWLDAEVVAGTRLNAVLHRYPGSGQYRALVGDRTSTIEPPSFPPAVSYAEVQRQWAALLAADPWATRMPAVLAGAPVPPRTSEDGWSFRDAEGVVAPLVTPLIDPWLLLACAAHGSVGVFGEWSGAGFRPLSVLPDDRGNAFTAGSGLAA